MAMEGVIRSVRILHWLSTASVEMDMSSIQMEEAVMVEAILNEVMTTYFQSLFQILMNVLQKITDVSKGA